MEEYKGVFAKNKSPIKAPVGTTGDISVIDKVEI
jgi:hypothetical protein